MHGPNRLPDAPKKSNVLRLLEQFANPLVVTLLAAAVIAVVVGFTAGGDEGVLARFGDAITILALLSLLSLLIMRLPQSAWHIRHSARRAESP